MLKKAKAKIKLVPSNNKIPELVWNEDMVDIRFFESNSFGCENPFKYKEEK